MTPIIDDKTFIGLVSASFVSTAASFYFLRQFLIKDVGVWTAPMFVPIYFYIVLIFAINTILGLVAYKKDRSLSLAFSFVTLSIDVLILLALILNIKNPNG
ncbi:MAG: hypothetical protein NTY30_03665 [Candidatus Berkelbacteria bacterium]|nr:hypothetical protein [Candidatus Berkelbacteria bacterium]